MTDSPENQTGYERPEPVELVVSHQLDGTRIDLFAAQQFPEFSRAFFQRGIKQGRIRINGRPCRPSDKLRTNDRVSFEWPEGRGVEMIGEDIALDVIAEDEDVLVLNKPPGLVVHPAKGNWTGTLVHGLLGHDQESFSELVDEQQRPGIVHRLDKDTSGVMVVAKNEQARFALSAAFAERRVEKTYLAIVQGEFGAKTGEIRTLIGRHPRDRKLMAVVEEKGKPAVTLYRVLATTGEHTLVEVRILTGRTHQIRVHFASLRHPILGDDMYGGRQGGLQVPVPRQMLHAWKLAFPHPRTGIMREYMGNPPEDFRNVLKGLGLPVVGRGKSGL